MTYRCGTLSLILRLFWEHFAFWMLFFTDLGRLAENAFDARKLYFVFAVLIPCKMPSNIQARINEVSTPQTSCVCGTKAQHYPVVFSYSKKMQSIDL
jgi:hypothetical protein